MNTANSTARTSPLLSPLGLVAFGLALLSVMVWSSVSIIALTHDMNVTLWLAWIPAVATDGAMLVATGWCVNHRLDQTIRRYAAGIAGTGIVGSVAVAAVEHYVTAAQITPRPELGALIGGIPSLMAALLVHVFAMIRAQQRREQAELESAHADLSTAKGVLAEAKKYVDEADRLRQEAHAKGLKEDAANRRTRHEAAVKDVERLQQELLQAETESATRSQHGLQQERNKVAALQAELDEALAAAEATRETTRALLVEVEADRERAGHLRSEAETDLAAADDARREAERLRSQLRRRNNTTTEPTAQRPVSQPVLQHDATSSQPASRETRREWALEKLREGVDVTGAAIDEQFGPPRIGSTSRTGAAILREAHRLRDAELNGELRVITSGAGGQ